MFNLSEPTSLEEPAAPTRGKAPYIVWRLWMLAVLAVLVFGVLSVRIYYLTVLRYPYFYEISENNYVFEEPVSAPRGRIMTADGVTIALNRTIYDIEMSPFGMEMEEVSRAVERLAELLRRPELIRKVQAVIDQKPRWKRLTLTRDLDLQSVAPVLERSYEIPGVLIQPRYSRHYPYGPLFGHLTGYVGAISPRQLPDYAARGYIRTDSVGKIGAERQFEEALKGGHGSELTIRDAYGRPRSTRIETPAMRGSDVVLTIDSRLQHVCDRLLVGSHGAAVVMDPRDGAILALVSKPDYDPNNPRKGAATGQSSSYDKVVRGLFAPASTFKLVTAAAALQQGRQPEESYHCNGKYQLASFERPFNCDVIWGHGSLDLYGALQKSCNVYFYRLADQLGRERMMEAAAAFGFGDPTGIDLISRDLEGAGILGNRKSKTVYRGSVIQMGIGQGALIAVTPIQLINAYAALANGGTRWRPHIFKEKRSPVGEVLARHEPEALGRLPLNESQRTTLLEGFRRVIQVKGGTAFMAGFNPAWDAAGKTGSAEVFGQEQTNGWFVTFAPMKDPEICILVLIEGQGHGGATAAPIAEQIMRSYFTRSGTEIGSRAVPMPTASSEKESSHASSADGIAMN